MSGNSLGLIGNHIVDYVSFYIRSIDQKLVLLVLKAQDDAVLIFLQKLVLTMSLKKRKHTHKIW